MSESGYWAAKDFYDAVAEELERRCDHCGEFLDFDEDETCADCQEQWKS